MGLLALRNGFVLVGGDAAVADRRRWMLLRC